MGAVRPFDESRIRVGAEGQKRTITPEGGVRSKCRNGRRDRGGKAKPAAWQSVSFGVCGGF